MTDLNITDIMIKKVIFKKSILYQYNKKTNIRHNTKVYAIQNR
jgi:hypothetical protein